MLKLGAMKYVYALIGLFLAAGCNDNQPRLETKIINGICFFELGKTQTNLTEQFTQTLLTGNKSTILNEALSLSDDHCWKTCLYQSDKKRTPLICDMNTIPLTVVSLNVRSYDQDYMGGHLNMYFDGEKLNAAELLMIKQK